MQLRKCCNHPYIFPGVEPEPFVLGEHLIETSGKLMILDKLLKLLKSSGHKVLIFSQMTMMLDIVQDYLGYRNYSYERLDGSVRGEERFLAVNNFNASQDTFIFLLSTRAGGQGLNLATADTVIFLDNDFNPQNDLQAAARAHRIGQTRPVKIIRLVSRNTVEEIILKRAENKLKLTTTVIEGGQFSSVGLSSISSELNDILKFGLDDLFGGDSAELDNEELERMIGESKNGAWLYDTKEVKDEKMDEKGEENEEEANMYVFEGHDYSKCNTTDQDKSKFESFVQAVNEALQTERNLRKDPKSTPLFLTDLPRKRKNLTDEEKAELLKKRQENKAKRQKLMEEKRIEKLKKLRETHNYISCKIETPDVSDSESVSSTESDEPTDLHTQEGDIEYVVGDLTKPIKTRDKDRIIAHCVDDSGSWGRGGLFSAIDKCSSDPKKQYELAAKVKDLELGDVHLVKFTEATKTESAIYVALIIAHTRDRNNVLSPLLLRHLSEALEKLHHIARETGASIHFPRIGYNTPNFNWYGTEKLIKKMLAQRKIQTLIYYFKRRHQQHQPQPQQMNTSLLQSASSSSASLLDTNAPDVTSIRDSETENSGSQNSELADIFSGCIIYFHDNIESTESKQLSRYVIAYDGDVEKELTSKVTHVVTAKLTLSENAEKINKLLSGFASCKIVNLNWVKECVQEGRLVDDTNFIVEINEETDR